MAHIRHVHTDYDQLLKSTSRNLARLKIEPKCLRVLLKWRGEDDEVDVEERTEEVIIIEDSEDESEDTDDEVDAFNYTSKQSRDDGVEIVSWSRRNRGADLYQEEAQRPHYNPKFFQLVRRLPMSAQPTYRPVPPGGIAYGASNPSYGSGYLPPPPMHPRARGGQYANPIVIPDSPQRLLPGHGFRPRFTAVPSPSLPAQEQER
jgi:Uncharacterized conserved protein (DUF2293)